MACYIVGDIQGCCDELQQLLHIANFDPQRDELWLTGDLVARGPKSLQTLRFVKSLGKSAKIVLGNHDLHLLAISQGIHKNNEKDKLSPIFDAPDCEELLTWLRLQPLLLRHPEFNFVMVHAGITAQWSIKQAELLAKEVEGVLHSNEFKRLLENMYGNLPNSWSESLQGDQRLRFIINVLTRMRYCFNDGALEFESKLAPHQQDNSQIKPWFEVQGIDTSSEILFGHWAALLGQVSTKGVYGLDTGCVWGNSLTMLRWQDKQLFTLPCPIHSS